MTTLNSATTRGANPMCLYLLGPSGVGKSTLAHALQESGSFGRVIPVMTRARRPGEVDGEDGLFMSEAEFQVAEGDGELVASSMHLGARYGFNWRQVGNIIDRGATPVVEAYAPRLAALRASFLSGPALLLLPDSLAWLEQRIQRRGAPQHEVEFRMTQAQKEVEWLDKGGIAEVNDVITVLDSTDLRAPDIVRQVRQMCHSFEILWRTF